MPFRYVSNVLGYVTWKLEAGSWKLEAGSWKLEVGYWILDVECWTLDIYLKCSRDVGRGSIPGHSVNKSMEYGITKR